MSIKLKQTALPTLRFPEFRTQPEWQEKPLSELGDILSGLTYSPDDVRDEGLLVLRSSNIQNGEISLVDKVYVTPDVKKANLSQQDDILICVRNGSKPLIGKNAIIPSGMQLCTHGAFMSVFRSMAAQFVFQLFQTSAYQRQVDGDLGATINSINSKNLKKYTFYVPGTTEQQKIANCLKIVDDLISTERQKLTMLHEHKTGLMQKLFPSEGERLPEFRFPTYKNEPDWGDKKLGEIAKFVRGPFGGALKKNIFVRKGYAVYEQSHAIYSDFTVFRYFIDKKKYDELKRFAVASDDLIMSCSGTMGKFAIIPKNAKDGVINQALLKLTIQPDYSLIFIKLALELPHNQEQLLSQSGGGAIKNVASVKQIKELTLYIPNESEQKKIAECLSSLDHLIASQEEKIVALQDHKKGLMQQLFPSSSEP